MVDCRDCSRPLPGGSDPRKLVCQDCKRARVRAWHHANRTRQIAKARARYVANSEAHKADCRDRRLANLARYIDDGRRYYAENKVAIRAKSRESRAANINECRAQNRASYARHREARKAGARKWATENPSKARVSHQNHRARCLVRNGGSVSPADWDARVAEFSGCCAYCLAPSQKLTMDHFRPISKDGDHSLDNIVPSCLSCNSSKHNALVFGFVPRMICQ